MYFWTLCAELCIVHSDQKHGTLCFFCRYRGRDELWTAPRWHQALFFRNTVGVQEMLLCRLLGSCRLNPLGKSDLFNALVYVVYKGLAG